MANRRNPFLVKQPLRKRVQAALAATICVTVLTVGCGKVETQFEIVSYIDAGEPTRFTEQFDHGSFAVNAMGNYEIAFRLPPTLITLPSQSQPAEPTENETAPPATQETWMSQIIHIEILWLPRPGTTHVEKTQTNATLRYCLIAGDDAISYEGAGFVYFSLSRDGKTIEGGIESSSLFPARWAGQPADLFGSCHLTGTFQATECRRDIAAAERRLRRLLGAPLKPGAHKTDPSQGPAD